ncbi:MAG: CDGSH-type Zn-finger protein/mannose-6-phosphate isomerase-like protein (cupin superfamily) [Gammaproteobacteria bacterium]|jgi:CDGSH-type Zn-finger protein/mannose-6-phosphate isomerase-like protein (cupin superfamily)
MTEKAEISALKPCLVSLKAGRPYAWCSCGRSSRQPFCDGAHKDTSFEPLRYIPEQDEDVLLCACKQTKTAPFCDGSHNNLSDTYAEAAPEDFADAAEVEYEKNVSAEFLTAPLDNGCYVVRGNGTHQFINENVLIGSNINFDAGAKHLAQYVAILTGSSTPLISFSASEVVVYIASGNGCINISGREFSVPEETGIYVCVGEAFSISNTGNQALKAIITVCPGDTEMRMLEQMPDNFDSNYPNRICTYDQESRDTMADRHLMELVNSKLGCEQVTQFIGEIPKSRAAFHHHLYEEAIYIMSGSGVMWTTTKKANVIPGDLIFLPERQAHSLECTDHDGMRLMGVFYPAGSPKVNY